MITKREWDLIHNVLERASLAAYNRGYGDRENGDPRVGEDYFRMPPSSKLLMTREINKLTKTR